MPTSVLDFYECSAPMQPDNVTITTFHTRWFGAYERLEEAHGFIQWIFPLRVPGVNAAAPTLKQQEIAVMRKSPIIQTRIRLSLDLMLDAYGMRIVDASTVRIERTPGYRARYENLLAHSHNFLRISRILTCLQELGMARYNVPILLFFLLEQARGELNSSALRNSMAQYWVQQGVWDMDDRDFITSLIRDVRQGKVNFQEEEYRGLLATKLQSGKWQRG